MAFKTRKYFFLKQKKICFVYSNKFGSDTHENSKKKISNSFLDNPGVYSYGILCLTYATLPGIEITRITNFTVVDQSLTT